jgi:hypothetical protein
MVNRAGSWCGPTLSPCPWPAALTCWHAALPTCQTSWLPLDPPSSPLPPVPVACSLLGYDKGELEGKNVSCLM